MNASFIATVLAIVSTVTSYWCGAGGHGTSLPMFVSLAPIVPIVVLSGGHPAVAGACGAMLYIGYTILVIRMGAVFGWMFTVAIIAFHYGAFVVVVVTTGIDLASEWQLFVKAIKASPLAGSLFVGVLIISHLALLGLSMRAMPYLDEQN